MSARDKINKEKGEKLTYSILDVSSGDIVKFSGTRNQGYRKVIQIERQEDGSSNYFSRVVEIKKNKFVVTNFTSNNSSKKMTYIYLNDRWIKIVK